MSYIPDDASSMSDDVFEDPETTQRRLEESMRHRIDFNSSCGGSSGLGSSIGGGGSGGSKACSTGYPGYRPPVKALQMYALEDAIFYDDVDKAENDDGWRSYRYDEVGMYNQPQQQPFDDTVNHKTILLGDSGVGKTSFLVKYNTGEFRLGSFSATVGIALTLHTHAAMRRKSSVRRGNSPIPEQLGTTTRSPNQHRRSESAQNDDIDPYDDADIPRRESLHKPTWQYIIPGQPLQNPNAATSSNARSKSLSVASDSDDDDDYLRRPSVVVHHHYYQEKEVQQQLHLPVKPLQQLRRASLHSGVCFKATNGGGSSRITRHHTIASADLRVTSDSSFPLRRKSSLAHPIDPRGLATQHDSLYSGGNTNKATFGTASTTQDGATFCRNAGRALMRLVSIDTKPKVKVEARTNGVGTYACGEEYDMMGKVIMLGDSGVGKTCVLIRFYDGKYMPNYYITTVGIDFRNKVVVVDGTRVKLQIWDTAGQERFRSVTHAYYRDAHALLLLYDVTNKTTYDNIRAWLGEIREYAQDDVVIVLIGNKADSSNSERQVKREDGERLAREHNVPFMETSAKTGLNVELAFSAVARQLKCRGTINGDDGKFNVHDFVRDNTRARTMCAQCKSM